MARVRGGSSRREERGEAQIRVRCANPDCEQVYTVPARYAGKRAQCTKCGAHLRIPARASVSTKTPPPRTGLRAPAAARTTTRPTKRGRVEPKPTAREVRIGCIGRGHAGKTALFRVLGDSLIGDFLPSGLHLDAADPREVARMLHESEEAHRLLHQSGLPPTLEVSQTRYCLFEGDRRRVVCRMREVIGQVLTHTMPDSEPELQAQYVEYITDLVNADVLWVVVPCPPADPGSHDQRRYANDLRITTAYLREALRLRTREKPAVVALILSKMDALFPSPDEARKALTEDVLHRALGPLVQLIQQSPHVSDAAIIPTTAFGFGKAVLRLDGGERHEAPGSAEEPFGDEPIWLLKEGESPQPYNLDTLFLWSLLMCLVNADPASNPELDKLSRMLRDDLEAANPWLVPLKGGVALVSA